MENHEKKIGSIKVIIIGIALICLAIVCLILFLTSGETIVTGNYSGTKILERLTCESDKVSYPLFDYNNASRQSLKVNAIFEDNSISSISLIYKLNYSNSDDIKISESINHAAMNIDYQKNDLNPDAFNATYSKLKDGLQFSIYTTGDDMNNKSLKYFMLDELSGKSYTTEKVSEIYNKHGLDCEIRREG